MKPFIFIKKHFQKQGFVKNSCSFADCGFTIIELVIVMAVFLFIIGAAIGIFLSVVQNQKKILAEDQLLNQIGYAEEYVSKALRMAAKDDLGSCLGEENAGYIYVLTHHDLSSGTYSGIKFINQSDNNACQEFYLSGLGTTASPYILKELKNSTNESDAAALTSESLKINSLSFAINGSVNCGAATPCGASGNNSIQPKVTIVLNVTIPGDSQEPDRTIQTTVSQRNLNIK